MNQPPIPLQNEKLAAAVREELEVKRKLGIAPADSSIGGLDWVTTLNASGRKLTEITEIQQLTNVSRLKLNDNLITKVPPLVGFTDLTELYLANNLLRKIDFVIESDLDNLEKLDLTNCGLQEVGPVTELENLTRLKIKKNRINDISPLLELDILERLDLGGNSLDFSFSSPDRKVLKQLVNKGCQVNY